METMAPRGQDVKVPEKTAILFHYLLFFGSKFLGEKVIFHLS
jgi:hypothetical protein